MQLSTGHGGMRLDAGFYEPAPARDLRQKGRPRLKGRALPKLSTVLGDPKTVWTRITMAEWYGGQAKQTAAGQARSGRPSGDASACDECCDIAPTIPDAAGRKLDLVDPGICRGKTVQRSHAEAKPLGCFRCAGNSIKRFVHTGPAVSAALVQIPHHGSRRKVGPTILDRLVGPKRPHGTASTYTNPHKGRLMGGIRKGVDPCISS